MLRLEIQIITPEAKYNAVTHNIAKIYVRMEENIWKQYM